jgi:two-component system response regulator YesN
MKKQAMGYMNKLIVFSLLLGIIPVLILGFFSYHKSANAIQKRVAAGNVQLLYQTKMRVEYILKSIDQSITNFSISPLMNRTTYIQLDENQYKLVGELIEGIAKLQTFDSGLSRVSIVNWQQDWVIKENGFSKLSDLSEQEQNQERNKWVRKRSEGENSPAVWHTVELGKTEAGAETTRSGYILRLEALFPLLSPEPIGKISAEIASSLLTGITSQLQPELSNVFIVDSQFRVIVQNPSSTLLEPDLHQVIDHLKIMNEAAEGQFQSRVAEQEVSVNFLKSDYTDWNYMSIIPNRELTRESRSIGIFTAVLCLLLFLFIMAWSILGSRRMYLPIYKLHQLVVHLSGGQQMSKEDEIAGIASRFLEMSNRTLLLNSQIKEHAQHLLELFILKLAQGTLTAREIDEKKELLGYQLAGDSICVLVLDIDSLEHTRFQDKDRDLLMYAVNNMIGEIIPIKNRLNPIIVQQVQMTVYGASDEPQLDFKNQVYNVCMEIQRTVNYVLGLKVSIGISRTVHSFTHVHRSYLEGVEALKYRVRLGDEAILFIEDVQPSHKMLSTYPESLAMQLMESCKLAERDKTQQFLVSFLQELSAKEMSWEEYQVSLGRLLSDLIRLVHAVGESGKDCIAENRVLFSQLLGLKTAAEIEVWMIEKVIDPILSLYEQIEGGRLQTICDEMMRIIHEKFDTELTLEHIGKSLNYHPGYLKNVFRVETGFNFSEYLAQHRLKVAKQWLVETDMKISEIAERLKYNNPQNFIRYFRRHEGITPGAYRAANKN